MYTIVLKLFNTFYCFRNFNYFLFIRNTVCCHCCLLLRFVVSLVRLEIYYCCQNMEQIRFMHKNNRTQRMVTTLPGCTNRENPKYSVMYNRYSNKSNNEFQVSAIVDCIRYS